LYLTFFAKIKIMEVKGVVKIQSITLYKKGIKQKPSVKKGCIDRLPWAYQMHALCHAAFIVKDKHFTTQDP